MKIRGDERDFEFTFDWRGSPFVCFEVFRCPVRWSIASKSANVSVPFLWRVCRKQGALVFCLFVSLAISVYAEVHFRIFRSALFYCPFVASFRPCVALSIHFPPFLSVWCACLPALSPIWLCVRCIALRCIPK